MPDVSIRIRRGSDETKTQQIFNQIASAILAGKLERGDALTSERALAGHLGVSRNIVRNAYRRLEEHGFVETVSTAGRRVRASKRRRADVSAGVDSRDRVAMKRGVVPGSRGGARKSSGGQKSEKQGPKVKSKGRGRK